jgi:hypothetical protein
MLAMAQAWHRLAQDQELIERTTLCSVRMALAAHPHRVQEEECCSRFHAPMPDQRVSLYCLLFIIDAKHVDRFLREIKNCTDIRISHHLSEAMN